MKRAECLRSRLWAALLLGLVFVSPPPGAAAPPDPEPEGPDEESVQPGHARLFVGVNFEAARLPDSGFIPPDTMGSVGPAHIVELINGRYSVFQKSDGRRVQATSLNQFWSNAGVTVGRFAFDPRILFDPFSERWFALSVDNSQGDNQFLVAVSNSSDPTEGWTGFAVDSDSTDLHWADYPTLGFNAEAVFVSANMFPISGRGAGLTNTIVAIPKSELIAGAVSTITLFENNSISETGFTVQPVVDLDNGVSPAAFLSSQQTSGFFRRSNVTGDITSPVLEISTALVPVTRFSERFSATQPPPAPNVEIANGGIFQANVVRRNGSFWGVQTVQVDGRAALRWFQIDAVTDVLLQEGLVASDELEFYYPSIAVNEFGDVVIGFNGSGPSQFISSYAVLGRTAAGVTIFGNPRLLREGAASYFVDFGTNRNRWGDYSATVADPSDPFTFWTFQEVAAAANAWATQVTQVTVGLDITIAIRPRGAANRIDLTSTRRVPVAILSTDDFDAASVSAETVRFGPTGTEAAPARVVMRDVDGDGDTDMVLRFPIQETGLQCGQASALLRGRTSSGLLIEGSDFIQTTRCSQP